MSEFFPITKHTADETINTITKLYNGENIDYITEILKIIKQRKHTWMGYLTIENYEYVNVSIIKQIIGKDGLHLKHFTIKYGVDLIWFDCVSNKFFVWGSKKLEIINALYALNRQIKRFIPIRKREIDYIEQQNTKKIKYN